MLYFLLEGVTPIPRLNGHTQTRDGVQVPKTEKIRPAGSMSRTKAQWKLAK